jgi:hypothetical protein
MSVSDMPVTQETVETMGGTQGTNVLIAALAAMWRGLVGSMPEHYRPERHYMRGPGPAYAKKYLQNH